MGFRLSSKSVVLLVGVSLCIKAMEKDDKSNIIFTNWECRQKLELNRKDKYAQNRRN